MVSVGDTVVNHKCIKPLFTIGGSVGCNIPEEGYGRTTLGPNHIHISPGYADPGMCINMNIKFRPTKHIGIMVEGCIATNPLDKNYYNDGSFEKSQGGSGGIYYIGTVLAGPYYGATFKNGNEFEVNLLMGLMTLYQAPVILNFDFGPPMPYQIPSYTNYAAAAEFGATFKFHITKSAFIKIDAAYTQSAAYNMYYNYNTMIATIGPSEPLPGPLGLFSASIGIEFKL